MTSNIKIVEELEKKQAQARQELLALHEALKVEVDSDLGEGDPVSVEQDRIVSFIQEQERQLESLFLLGVFQVGKHHSHGGFRLRPQSQKIFTLLVDGKDNFKLLFGDRFNGEGSELDKHYYRTAY